MLSGRMDRLGNLARMAVAISPDTDQEVLEFLAGDHRNQVREAVFLNLNLPRWLNTLSKGRIPTRKTWLKNIAAHQDHIEEKLETWSKSGLGLHMYLLMTYPNTPIELIKQMILQCDVPVGIRELILKRVEPDNEIIRKD